MRKTIALLLAVTISACTGVGVEAYAGRGPVFSAEAFFDGSLRAHGVVKNYRGFASRSFVADITACWQNGVGTLDERFVFDDGENQTRVWRLTESADGSYAATAGCSLCFAAVVSTLLEASYFINCAQSPSPICPSESRSIR